MVKCSIKQNQKWIGVFCAQRDEQTLIAQKTTEKKLINFKKKDNNNKNNKRRRRKTYLFV